MPVFNLFSKRMAAERGEVVDVYQYDSIPQKLRIQAQQIIEEVLGSSYEYRSNEISVAYREIVHVLRREHGVMYLDDVNKFGGDKYMEELLNFVLQAASPDQFFDAIEMSVTAFNAFARKYSYRNKSNYDEICDDAVNELNHRFKENGVGFELSDGGIIRIDSELIHANVVKPVIGFLNSPMYAGPREEFLGAHSHYRNGENKEAIVDCLKAFESTMKAICDKHHWTYDKGKATAKDLIAVCLANGLIPTYWQNSVTNLRGLLESSVPTGRNKTSGHGQGALPVAVDEPVVEYIMHMTASTILFLARSEKDLA